jgi:hypothetical protein
LKAHSIESVVATPVAATVTAVAELVAPIRVVPSVAVPEAINCAKTALPAAVGIVNPFTVEANKTAPVTDNPGPIETAAVPELPEWFIDKDELGLEPPPKTS